MKWKTGFPRCVKAVVLLLILSHNAKAQNSPQPGPTTPAPAGTPGSTTPTGAGGATSAQGPAKGESPYVSAPSMHLLYLAPTNPLLITEWLDSSNIGCGS